MRLLRTQFAIDAMTSHLEGIGRNALIESFFVQYLLVCFYSEVESELAKIIASRLAAIGDAKVACFVQKTNDAMIRRTKKADINDILKKFGCSEDALLGDNIDDVSIQPYFDAITNRHLVSHSDGSGMTFEDFRKSLVCAEQVFLFVERAIAADPV